MENRRVLLRDSGRATDSLSSIDFPPAAVRDSGADERADQASAGSTTGDLGGAVAATDVVLACGGSCAAEPGSGGGSNRQADHDASLSACRSSNRYPAHLRLVDRPRAA